MRYGCEILVKPNRIVISLVFSVQQVVKLLWHIAVTKSQIKFVLSHEGIKKNNMEVKGERMLTFSVAILNQPQTIASTQVENTNQSNSM